MEKPTTDATCDADSAAAVGPGFTLSTSADASSPRSNNINNDAETDDSDSDMMDRTELDNYLDHINLNSTSTEAPLFSLKSSTTTTTMGATTASNGTSTTAITPGIISTATGITGMSNGSTSFAIGASSSSTSRIGISRSTSTRTYEEATGTMPGIYHKRSASNQTMPAHYWNILNAQSTDSNMATIGHHPSHLHQSPGGVLSPSHKSSVDMNVGDEFEIEEGTPADEALKANARVRVTKIQKAARYMNAQSIKKIWSRKSGNKKGKPPRVPHVPEEQLTRRWSDGDIDMVFLNRSSLKGINEDEEIEDGSDMDGMRIDVRYYNKDEVDYNDSHLHNYYLSDKKDKGDEEENGELQKEESIHKLDSVELSIRDYNEIAPTGTEEDPDATVVEYDPIKFDAQPDAQPIVLRDKHGKKRVFTKFKKSNKRKESKKKSRNYVKGKVIEKEHELYTLSIAVMLGLRYAIYQTHIQLENDKMDKRFWLDSEEFMRMQKYVFRPDGAKGTPPHKLAHTFKFKDYSPVPFAYIRRMFGINEYEFIHSVCGNANFIEFISNAKSGQFFFYSSDGKYMIKTMTNTESKFLRRSEYSIGCTYL